MGFSWIKIKKCLLSGTFCCLVDPEGGRKRIPAVSSQDALSFVHRLFADPNVSSASAVGSIASCSGRCGQIQQNEEKTSYARPSSFWLRRTEKMQGEFRYLQVKSGYLYCENMG